MARDRKSSGGGDEGGGANWMDTYGDLVTLLLCFFVLLFSFSSIDAAKWEALVGALSGSTVVSIPVLNPDMAMQRPIETIMRTAGDVDEENPLVDPLYPDATEQIMTPAEIEAYNNFMEFVGQINDYILGNNISATVEVDPTALVAVIRFGANVFFDSGDAAIRADGTEPLNQFIDLLVDHESLYSAIRIEGHTDDRPIHTAQFPSNWELSMFRAVNTLHYILDSGKLENPGLLSAAGYGEYHPVDTNDTPEGRALNRRVDFVINGIRATN